MNQEPLQLKGRRILLTGGTTGIGRATACMLASHGANVFVCGRHRQELEDAIEESRCKGAPFSGTLADVSRTEEVDRLFAEALEHLGGLEILIANAALGADGVEDEEHWRYIIDTNISGYIDCIAHAVRHLQERGDTRHIVLIGSMSADVMNAGSSVYVATKSAIQGLATSLRKELNPKGIHVSLVEPGLTQSDMVEAEAEEQEKMIAEEKMLLAEDVADVVCYLLSRPPRCSVVNVKLRPLQQLI